MRAIGTPGREFTKGRGSDAPHDGLAGVNADADLDGSLAHLREVSIERFPVAQHRLTGSGRATTD
jgi:hypothetical protein